MFGLEVKKIEKYAAKGDVEKVLKYLNRKDGPARLAAVAALGTMQDDMARNNLITVLYHDSREYRLAAARALRCMHSAATREHIKRYLPQESDPQIVEELQAALQEIQAHRDE